LSPLQHMSRMAEATDLAQGGIAQHSASQVSELQQKLEEASAPTIAIYVARWRSGFCIASEPGCQSPRSR
jgi:hypothetical protein